MKSFMFLMTLALSGLAFARVAKPTAPVTKEPVPLAEQAKSELQLAPSEISAGVLPTPATVRSRISPVKSPLRPLAYRLGLSLQPYQPQGTMSVGGSTPYELSVLGTRPMVAVEGQWLPLTFESLPTTRFGVFTSFGYAQHTMDLKSPTGVAMENTQVHSMKLEGGLAASYQLPRESKWSVHGMAGAGRLSTVQSSTSSYANQSQSLTFAALGASVERSFFEGVSGYAGYESRLAMKADDGASIPRDNYSIGFLSNFE